MTKKDDMRDALNYAGKNASGKLHQATGNRGTQEEASPEEKLMRQQDGRTQGRLGCKMPRINMAFTPENHDFIKKASHYKMMNLTEFVNYIIETYRKEHAEAWERAKETAEDL